jgi:hypothetical protein
MRDALAMPPLLSLVLTCLVVGLLFVTLASTALKSWATEWTTRLQRVLWKRTSEMEMGAIIQRPSTADREDSTPTAGGMV